MIMSKLVHSMEDAVRAAGIKSGMTIDFHHHLRNGDDVLPMVMRAIKNLGIRDITIFSSAIFDAQMDKGLTDMILDGTVARVDITGQSLKLGMLISGGKLANVARYRTHGGRPNAIISGEVHIDVSFIAASTADPMGNCSGMEGPKAFGSLGYALTSCRYADKVVVVTDHLSPYPLQKASIDETLVDYVVKVDSIGDTDGIATGMMRPTKSPIAFILAEYAACVICHSGLMVDGFSFQAGGGGASIATTQYVREEMLKKKVQGSFILGGINEHSVRLMEEGCFESLLDVQCFDEAAVGSIRTNPRHREISDSCYANPGVKSCVVDKLDCGVLGALQIDVNFNCNLQVNSLGVISGGPGGHGDVAAGAKLAVVVAPLMRNRFASVVEKVECVSTPGENVDVVVTQYGVAVNPGRPELRLRLKDSGIRLADIEELKDMALKMTGRPKPIRYGDKVVAQAMRRDGGVLSFVYNKQMP